MVPESVTDPVTSFQFTVSKIMFLWQSFSPGTRISFPLDNIIMKWQNLVFQALPELENATPLSLWKLPNSCTGMDTISRGGERLPFLKCGTSGSLLTPQGSFILCENKQGTNRINGQFFKTLDQSNPSRTAPRDTSGTTGRKVFFICHTCPWVLSSFTRWPVYSYITLTTLTWSFFTLCISPLFWVHIVLLSMPLRLLWRVLEQTLLPIIDFMLSYMQRVCFPVNMSEAMRFLMMCQENHIELGHRQSNGSRSYVYEQLNSDVLYLHTKEIWITSSWTV